MGTKEQIKQYKNSTAESFFTLSVGLWSVAAIGYLGSGISWETYLLIAFGGLFALFSIYLSIYRVLPFDLKQESVLECLETKQIMKFTKLLGWFILLMLFAVGLYQTKVGWLMDTGLIIIIVAGLFFWAGLWRAGTYYKKRKRLKEAEVGTKGRKNVKKPKKAKKK